MADWVICTSEDGDPIYANLSNAMSIFWDDADKYTIISYAGGDEDVLRVRDRPEAILKAGNLTAAAVKK